MADLGTLPSTAVERPSPADAGLLLLRLFAGLSLAAAHGIGKIPPSEGFVAGVGEMGFPLPGLFAWASGLAETLGGLLLAVGLFARPAALFVLINMLVASFIRQVGDPFLERELSLLYCAVAACLLLSGAGRLSLDALLRRRSRKGGYLAPIPARTRASRVRPRSG